MGATEGRYHKTYSVTWDQLQRDCRALAWRLMEMRSWKHLLSIARGGLVPAAIIARELNIRYIDTVCVSSYVLKDRGKIDILKRPDLQNVGEDTLIIDDLVDTGKTAQVVRNLFPKAHFAAVYAKPEGKSLVDTYITEVSQDTWILFPWDSDVAPTFCSPIVDIR